MTSYRYASSAPVTMKVVRSLVHHKKVAIPTTALLVTEQNVEYVRTLWKFPEAKPGDVVVKARDRKHRILTSEEFGKRYRWV